MENLKVETPIQFLSLIPTEIKANLEFRKNLHSKLAKDIGLQKTFLQLCSVEPRIAFNSAFFTLDPRKPEGQRNLPFILRPKQEEALSKVNNCIKIGKDGIIEKTRDEGATELLIKLAVLKVITIPETWVLVGSRSEDLVDKTDTKGTLFEKIDYCISTLPIWWKNLLNGRTNRVFKHFGLMDINSAIDGEATSIHFGAGKRTTFTIVDELGQVDESIASKIVFNLSDVGRCNLYNSTHFYGTGHTFAKLLKRDGIEVIKLLWYQNPEKSQGLYESPKVGQIQILDKKYYLDKFPEIFSKINLDKSFDYTEFSKKYKEPIFIADGKEKQPIILRSPWHDKEEKERDFENLSKNIWAYPAGATDSYFDSFVNDRIRSQFIKNPKFQGEILYQFEYKEGIKTKKIISSEFKRNFGKNPLKWWGDLFNDKNGILRPLQTHNYIIGCDISFGLSSSNSTAMIRDVNTKELIGEYVTCGLYPQDFGYLVAALALWVGGATKVPYIIWERNGGGGQIFGETILGQGFNLVYTDTIEDTKTRIKKKRYGWTSVGGVNGSKNLLLGNLKNALKESLNKEKISNYIIIYSEELINELDSYMWYSSGDVDSGENIDLTTGARARHGDRIIGTALTILGDKEQPKAVKDLVEEIPYDSWQWRRNRQLAIEKENKEFWRDPIRKRIY